MYYNFVQENKKNAEINDYIGLTNDGNRCYVNSVIQSLFSIEQFKSFILNFECDTHTNFSEANNYENIIISLQNVFLKLQSLSKTPVLTTRLTNTLGWRSREQEDVHEFFLHFVNTVSSCCDALEIRNVIKDLFLGILINYQTCLSCKNETATKEEFLYITVPIKTSDKLFQTLQEALENLLLPEILNEPNRVHCLKCNEFRNTKKGHIFVKLPPIMTVLLERFNFEDGQIKKNNSKITLPETIDLKFLLETTHCHNKYVFNDESTSKDQINSYIYYLHSIIVHKGDDIKSGHYFVYIFDSKKEQWICFNDSAVTYANKEEIFKSFGTSNNYTHSFDTETAYLLIYKKKSNEKHHEHFAKSRNQIQSFNSIPKINDKEKIPRVNINYKDIKNPHLSIKNVSNKCTGDELNCIDDPLYLHKWIINSNFEIKLDTIDHRHTLYLYESNEIFKNLLKKKMKKLFEVDEKLKHKYANNLKELLINKNFENNCGNKKNIGCFDNFTDQNNEQSCPATPTEFENSNSESNNGNEETNDYSHLTSEESFGWESTIDNIFHIDDKSESSFTQSQKSIVSGISSYSRISSNKSIKYIKGLLAVCSFCKMTSSDFSRCQRCKKNFSDAVGVVLTDTYVFDNTTLKNNPQTILQEYKTYNKDRIQNCRNFLKRISIRQVMLDYYKIIVRKENIYCLKEHQWLNDTIINFYLHYVFHEKIPNSIHEKSFLFNSFCFTNLKKVAEIDGRTVRATQRFFCNRYLLEKDYIIVPINQQHHWLLAIICYPYMVDSSTNDDEFSHSRTKIRKTMNKKKINDGKKTCILILNSLGTYGCENVSETLLKFLNNEYFKKQGIVGRYTKKNCETILLDVPQQTNSSDCGLYVLQYVESFFQNPIDNLYEILSLQHWFSINEIILKRIFIWFLIVQKSSDYLSGST